MALLVGLASAADAGPQHGHKKSRKELKGALSGIRGKKSEVRKELRATREKAHGVKVDIQTVDNRLETAHSQLQGTQHELSVAQKDSLRAAGALEKATTELHQTRKLVELRIRRIYMEGNESALSTLTGTKAAGEVASNGFLMQAIKRKDRAVFNRYVALQRDVARKKRDADGRVREVVRLKSRETIQARALADSRQAKAQLLNKLRGKEEDLESMMAQFQKDEEQIGSEIEAFEREAAAAARRSHGNHGGGGHYSGSFNGRFQRPVGASITSTFGMRYHPILHRTRMHTGIDFGASYGTPIHAAAAGQVIYSSFMNGYGHVVIIDHGDGYSTVYAHASRVYVSSGQHVSAGQTIAAVGASGLATGPHLHFEVRHNGHPIDPLGKL